MNGNDTRLILDSKKQTLNEDTGSIESSSYNNDSSLFSVRSEQI